MMSISGVLFLLLMSYLMYFYCNFKMLKLLSYNYMYTLSFLMLTFICESNCNWSSVSLYFMMGLDQYNYVLLIFMFWLIGLCLMSLSNGEKLMLTMFYYMCLFLFISFISLSYMVFYMFFEASIIPIFIIIVSWGMNDSRWAAGLYMIMFTLFFSLPMLIIMCIFMYYLNNSFIFNDLMFKLAIHMNLLEYILFILSFLVKMPMFMIHFWLPKAHVEAPCSGSMVLAGILLKLGSYGMLRSMIILPSCAMKWNKFMIMFSLVGTLLSSMICLFQVDLKMLIAYSSVVHMNMMLGSMGTLFMSSYIGSIYMMIGHGLCSSGLFYITNISYTRIMSRHIYINKGLINLMPSMTMWWFLLCSSNMASPVSLNLISEILLINSIVTYDNFLLIIMVLISFMSACYCIYLFSMSQQGLMMSEMLISKMDSGKMMEFIIIFLHWFPLNVLMLNLNLFFHLMNLM